MKNVMQKKLFISLIIIFLLITKVCYAATAITEDALKKALEEFTLSDSNDENYEITVENNEIIIISDDVEYKLKYELTGNPKFVYEVEITNGMSYDEYQEKTDNLSIPMIGYLAVANTQGIDFEDSSAYFAIRLVEAAFSGSDSLEINDAEYMIVSDDVNVEETDGQKVIKESEFGNYAMEYVKAMYGEKKSFSDSANYDTFEWTTELEDETSTSCKIVSTLSINSSADFLQLDGFADNVDGSGTNNNPINIDEPAEPEASEQPAQPIESEEPKNDNTSSNQDIVNTGSEDIIIVLGILTCLIFAIIFGMINKKYKEI